MPRSQLSPQAEDAMRRRLVEAGLRLYRAEGLGGVTFRRLADAMGLSHTLPYRYFADKEALLAAMRRAAVRRFERHLRLRSPAGAGAEAQIRAIAAAYVAFARRHTADYLLIFTTDQPPPTRYPELLAARRAVFDYAMTAVQAGVESGLLAGDARSLAHLFWVGLHGLTTLHAANQLVHGRALGELVDPLVDGLLRAAAAPVPAVPVRLRPSRSEATS